MTDQTGFVYLDHNATTPLRPEAIAAMRDAAGFAGNPSSVHRAGRAQRQRLEQARAAVARGIGLAETGTLIFTSGGTEANALALAGTGRPRLFRSAIEHDSVRQAREDSVEIPVRPDGMVDLAGLAGLLAACSRPALVSVMAANNETGVVQPIAEIARIAHAAGALVHCDAVQAIGKIGFDMGLLGLDLVSLSAHKLGGPPGVGALAVAPGLDLAPLQRGGGQERGLRAGTENVPGIAGFAAALEAACMALPDFQELAGLRDEMERRLLTIEPGALRFGADTARLPNTSCIALPGIGSEVQVMALDLAGIGVSAGAACSSGKVRPSHVLSAMGVESALARQAIRISLGRDTVEADIDALVAAWGALAIRHRLQRGAA